MDTVEDIINCKEVPLSEDVWMFETLIRKAIREALNEVAKKENISVEELKIRMAEADPILSD